VNNIRPRVRVRYRSGMSWTHQSPSHVFPISFPASGPPYSGCRVDVFQFMSKNEIPFAWAFLHPPVSSHPSQKTSCAEWMPYLWCCFDDPFWIWRVVVHWGPSLIHSVQDRFLKFGLVGSGRGIFLNLPEGEQTPP